MFSIDVAVDGFIINGTPRKINGESPCNDFGTPTFSKALPNIQENLWILERCMMTLPFTPTGGDAIGKTREIFLSILRIVMEFSTEGRVGSFQLLCTPAQRLLLSYPPIQFLPFFQRQMLICFHTHHLLQGLQVYPRWCTSFANSRMGGPSGQIVLITISLRCFMATSLVGCR